MTRFIASIFFCCFVFVSASFANDNAFRIQKLISNPDWFSISGKQRNRFETLDGQYRGSRNGGDQILVSRTLIKAGLNLNKVRFVVEGMDARAWQSDSGTPLSTTIVNPLDILQAYTELSIDNLFSDESTSKLRLGRITMDVGSRRFVARNRYRNTINNFTGLDWQWQSDKLTQFRAFYTLPVQRLVSGNIADNDAKLDKQHDEVKFWGLFYSPGKFLYNSRAELFLFGLNEKDVPNERQTRDRDIYTPGFRVYKKPSTNHYDYQIETALQFGESRFSSSSVTDLDHFAHFHHFEIGYSFDYKWSPHLSIQYDYASGDDDLADADNNRFDTLFGARRFDYGPTSIYGPFARSNLSSPGIRLKLKPSDKLKVFFAARGYWLASDNDNWTTARISNAAGSSDNYIGSQVETRLRWDVFPGNFRIETGAAYLVAGDLMRAADKNDSKYFYSQFTFWF